MYFVLSDRDQFGSRWPGGAVEPWDLSIAEADPKANNIERVHHFSKAAGDMLITVFRRE